FRLRRSTGVLLCRGDAGEGGRLLAGEGVRLRNRLAELERLARELELASLMVDDPDQSRELGGLRGCAHPAHLRKGTLVVRERLFPISGAGRFAANAHQIREDVHVLNSIISERPRSTGRSDPARRLPSSPGGRPSSEAAPAARSGPSPA